MRNATHHFVYVGHDTQTKNKLQEEFKVYLKSLEGTLVDADKIQGLKNQIVDKSIDLNEKHKRCAPLKISFEKRYGGKGFMISGFYFLIFQLLPAYHGN